jgi:hypothetical protein
MMANKVRPFTTATVDVRWSHLHAPDVKFGEDSANHNITIVVTEDLQKELDKVMAEAGASKINGLRTDDEGVTLLKAKSKNFVKKGTKAFPCRDASAAATDATPYGGDKVRLRLAPITLTRDNSLSCFLNGCQIIEKNEMGGGDGGGFEATDGFDGSTYSAPTAEDTTEAVDDVPF